MRFYRDRFAFVALVTFLLVGSNAPAAPRPPGPMHPESIVQPFLITFELRSVRNTGRLGRRQDVPPVPQGFTLRLSTEEGFSLSTDEHENLVTGTASRQVSDNTTTWTLHPMDPPWTQGRTVRASVSRYGPWHRIENTVGAHGTSGEH